MVYNTLVPKMATNFDKSHDLKASTSNLHGEEFLKTFCISVIRRATKLCFMYDSFLVILFKIPPTPSLKKSTYMGNPTPCLLNQKTGVKTIMGV